MIYCNRVDATYNGIYRNTFNNLQYIDDGTHYNKDFWAFAYKEDERALNLMCKPVKGRIKEDKYFYEYKVNGEDLKKNGVTIYARLFANTYEEAVDGFNKLALVLRAIGDEWGA